MQVAHCYLKSTNILDMQRRHPVLPSAKRGFFSTAFTSFLRLGVLSCPPRPGDQSNQG